MLFCAVLITFFSVINYSFSEELTIKVDNIKNKNGEIVANVYSKEKSKGFPTKNKNPICTTRATIISGGAILHCDGLSPGFYAARVFHDENRNKKIDHNWIGYPSEGFGFSNNARVIFGPPKFSAAEFIIRRNENLEIGITLKYF